MKVVLLKDVKNTGRVGEIVDVSDGHAVNMLIPRKLAIIATPAAIQKAKAAASQQVARKDLDKKLVEERLASLAEGRIVIVKRANDGGHLYDAVGAKDIADAIDLPEAAIKLEKPLKEVGTHQVPVAYGGAFGSVTIVVEAA